MCGAARKIFFLFLFVPYWFRMVFIGTGRRNKNAPGVF